MSSWSRQSRATPSTLCQKCLKRGHYSYECTAAQQSRPYVSRPSRSQQFSNPKLAPKISDKGVKPPEELLKPASNAKDSEPERSKTLDDRRSRPRSTSASSFDSVSTISTNRSRSPRRNEKPRRRYRSRSSSRGSPKQGRRRETGDNHRSDALLNRRSTKVSSPEHSSRDEATRTATSHDRSEALRTGRRSRSRSPYHSRVAHKTEDRRIDRQRERSLSPYSRRRAMADDP